MTKLLVLLLLVLVIFQSMLFAKPKNQGKNQETQKKLEWIFTPYSVYSEKDYFAAVGSAKRKTESELKAVENLASIFGQDIQTHTASEMHAVGQEAGNDISKTFVDSSLSVQVQTEVNQKDLIGVEIKESYFDEAQNTWYTLALLDKKKTTGLYEKIIQKNADSIEQLTSFANSKKDSIEKFTALYKASSLASLNESYFPRFYIINPEKCDALKNLHKSSVQLRLESNIVAEKIPFGIKIPSVSFSKELKNSCAELLESFGFVIDQKEPVYELTVELNNNVRKVQNPEMFYSEFTIMLQINKNDSIYLSWDKTGRAGGKTQELSEQKMNQMICNLIKTEYKNVLEEFFLWRE